MDYLFWRKNSIVEPWLDRDPSISLDNLVPVEARNVKFFRGIERDPLELVRYAESECQAWFNASEIVPTVPQALNIEEPQVLKLSNICMTDESWTSTAQFSGYGWVWLDSLRKVQFIGTWNQVRRETSLYSEVEALRWAIECMLQYSTCQSFGTDCKDSIAMINEPHAWPSFATELERINTLKICFPDFKITHIPRTNNQISDFLARIARSFHRVLYFIGCSIPVWLPRPPQVWVIE